MPTVPGPAELLRTLLNMMAAEAAPNPKPPTMVRYTQINTHTLSDTLAYIHTYKYTSN